MPNSKTEASGLLNSYLKQVVAPRSLTTSDRDPDVFCVGPGPEADSLLEARDWRRTLPTFEKKLRKILPIFCQGLWFHRKLWF